MPAWSAVGLILTGVSALAWALFDATRKKLARAVVPAYLGVWLTLVQAPLLALWAATQGPPVLPGSARLLLLASIVLNGLGVLWFLQALRLSPLSITVPLLSFTPVLSTLLAWGLRHQVPTAAQGAGALLVVLGAAVLGIRAWSWGELRTFFREPGVPRMGAAALVWSLTALIDQAAIQRGAGAWYAPALTAGVGLLLAAVLVVLGQGSGLRQAGRQVVRLPGWMLLTAALGSAALAVQLEALARVPVGLVETVKRGVGMAGAVLLGAWCFGESLTWGKGLAVLLLTAGVALVVG